MTETASEWRSPGCEVAALFLTTDDGILKGAAIVQSLRVTYKS